MTGKTSMNTPPRFLLLLLSFLPPLLGAPSGAATQCRITVGDRLADGARLVSVPEISFDVRSRDIRIASNQNSDGPATPQWSPLIVERRYTAAQGDWKQWWAEATALIPRFESSVVVPTTYLRTVTVNFDAENRGIRESVATLRCDGGFPLAYTVAVGPDGSAVERLTVAVKKVTLQPTP